MARPSLTLRSSAAWFAGRRAEVRLAVRVAVAGVAAYALASFLGLAQGYWAVFTAVIVMQGSVGGSLKATLDRLVSTLGGAVVGGGVALLMARDGPLSLAGGLAIALLPLGFLAAIDARFRVAPVTAVIVLISPFGQQANPLAFTFERITEIALGSVVALAVSLLVLPARAHNLLADSTAKLLGLSADFLVLVIGGLTNPIDGAELRRLQVATRRSLAGMETIVDEARRERAMRLTDDPDPDPILRTSQRIRADLIMLARAAVEPLPAPLAARLGPRLVAIAVTGGAQFRALAVAFATRTRPPTADALDVALRAYRGEIAALRQERGLSSLSGEAVGRIFALGFGLDQLRENLGDLADRAAEFARAPVTPSQ